MPYFKLSELSEVSVINACAFPDFLHRENMVNGCWFVNTLCVCLYSNCIYTSDPIVSGTWLGILATRRLLHLLAS